MLSKFEIALKEYSETEWCLKQTDVDYKPYSTEGEYEMKKLDKNQKICIIALAVFVLFLIGFFVLSNLVQSGTISDVTSNQRIQGILSFAIFCLCVSLCSLEENILSPRIVKQAIS